jgi:quercetin dioxygenase-like cupin family protein
MKNVTYFLFCLTLGLITSFYGYSQHNHTGKDTTKAKNPFQISGIFSTFMSDPELMKYKMESAMITVAPKYTDTVSHTHDGELFGYVIEGSVEIGLNHQTPTLFKTGEMFYEKRNIIHSFLKNPDEHTITRILLITIIKEGRSRYTPLYPKK